VSVVKLERSKNPTPPLLVFIHVPRTAGTALRRVLALNEVSTPGQAVGNIFKGSGGVDHELIHRLRHMRGSGVSGARLARGHVPLAFGDQLDDGRGVRCFTLLRDPVDRMLSHFFTVREEHAGSKRSAVEQELGLAPLPVDATLEGAIAAGYLHDNLQTRMLSSVAEPLGDVTDEMLEQAKRNLDESLVFFGLTERFDESLLLAGRRLELRCILSAWSPRTDRVNDTRPRGEAVPPDLAAAAERANRYDLELYRHAVERFDANIELAEPGFQVEFAALRVAKGPGEIGIPRPAPPTFDGSPEVWRQLVRTTARAQRLEWQLAEQRLKSTSARSKIQRLEEQVGQVERTPSRASPADAGDHLDATTARIRELEAAVRQLRADVRRRSADVERLVVRLRDAQNDNRELQRDLREARVAVRVVPAGRWAAAKRTKPEEPVPKRSAKRGVRKDARPGPKHPTRKRPTELTGDDG
jgi:uncharacterized coiled-coil protein SlyX